MYNLRRQVSNDSHRERDSRSSSRQKANNKATHIFKSKVLNSRRPLRSKKLHSLSKSGADSVISSFRPKFPRDIWLVDNYSPATRFILNTTSRIADFSKLTYLSCSRLRNVFLSVLPRVFEPFSPEGSSPPSAEGKNNETADRIPETIVVVPDISRFSIRNGWLRAGKCRERTAVTCDLAPLNLSLKCCISIFNGCATVRKRSSHRRRKARLANVESVWSR